MKKNILSVLLVLVLASAACSFSTNLTPAGETTGETPLSSSAQANGLSAESTSTGGVLLKWDPIDGAEHYLVEVQVGDEFIPLATLPADQVSYEDLSAPPATRFTYRLSSLVDARPGDSREITIETPPETGNPLQVSIEFDQSAAVLDPNTFDPSTIDPNNFDPSMFMPQPVQAQALIGPQGGEVSVTGSNGVTYTLSVPPNALRFDVPITLKPVSGIPDLPLSGGLTAAVFVGPGSLVFDIPATLTTTPPADFPAAAGPLKLAFSFAADGQEFHLHPFAAGEEQGRLGSPHLAMSPRAGPLSFVLDLIDGGGYGQGSGTGDDVKKIVARPASNSQDRMAQRMAVSQLDDLAPLQPINDLAPLAPARAIELAKLGESILQKAGKADTWSKFLEVLDDFSTYTNAGGDKYEFNQKLNNKILDKLVDKAQALLKKNKGECLTQDDFMAQNLVERLTNPQGSFSTAFAGRFKQKYGQQLLDDLANGKKACSFKLTMKSSIVLEGLGSIMTVTAEIASTELFLNYSQGEIYLSGMGTMKEKIKFDPDGPCATFPIQQYPELGFYVSKLLVVFVDGKLNDFNLMEYEVQGWTKAAGLDPQGEECLTSLGVTGGGDYWTGQFMVAQILRDQSSNLKGWDVKNNLAAGSSLVATRQSDVKALTLAGNGAGAGDMKMIEDTKFVLTVTKKSK